MLRGQRCGWRLRQSCAAIFVGSPVRMGADPERGGMCICVDCRWVDRCQAYHAVERQHGAPHLAETPDVKPVDPQIHISVMDLPDAQVGVEWDVRACGSFELDAGRWLRLRPGEELPR